MNFDSVNSGAPKEPAPINMVLHCPKCGLQHIDADTGEETRIAAAERGFEHGSRDWEAWVEKNEWTNPPHRSHLCHGCKHVWRPADVPTNGVQAVATKGKDDSPIVSEPWLRRHQRHWQQVALDHGLTYWRAPDAHGVSGSTEQAEKLLADLLGVEVELQEVPR